MLLTIANLKTNTAATDIKYSTSTVKWMNKQIKKHGKYINYDDHLDDEDDADWYDDESEDAA